MGKVKVVHSPAAARISISVRRDGEVRLTLPRGVGRDKGLVFLDDKIQWVERARARVEARGHVPCTIGEQFSTRTHRLRMTVMTREDIMVTIRRLSAEGERYEGEIEVCYPAGMEAGDMRLQEMIRKAVESVWRWEAQTMLPSMVERIAAATGLSYGAVTVRNSKSRWGSCSGKNDISLSLHLMRLPDHLVEYVILHELCHTVHKNHSPRFHALVDRHLGGCEAALRKEMRTYSTSW